MSICSPSHFAVAVGSIVGTQMAVKVGTKVIVTSGLVMFAAFLIWIALTIDPTTGYAVIAGQMVLGGIGLGFTSAPATESVMGAVSISQAGVGSAVNDSTRLIGGTLGVAVIGSVFNSVFRNDIGRHLAASANAAFGSTVRESAGAAFAVSKKVAASGHPALGAQIHQVASDAFIHGFHVGCLVAAGVAGFGVLLAARLPSRPAPRAWPPTWSSKPSRTGWPHQSDPPDRANAIRYERPLVPPHSLRQHHTKEGTCDLPTARSNE